MSEITPLDVALFQLQEVIESGFARKIYREGALALADEIISLRRKIESLEKDLKESREMLEKTWAERDPAILRDAQKIRELEQDNEKMHEALELISHPITKNEKEMAREALFLLRR